MSVPAEDGSKVQLVILSIEEKIVLNALTSVILEAVSMVTIMMGRLSMATAQFRIQCLSRHTGKHMGGRLFWDRL